jgi:5-methylthioadenosine/S-adenosylhomocysteine deaminase
MQNVETLLHCRWVVPVIPEKVFLENHSVAVKDGKIFDILPTDQAKLKYNAEKTVQLDKNHVLIPGLVNLHCHSAMSLLRGFADDVQLMDWLLVRN